MNMITILVVDDQPEYITAYAAYFFEEKIPYKIISALNGKMAIDLAIKEKPDIIIMDWHMPVMNGLTALKKLKRNPELCDIPVIFASGIMLSSEDLRSALEAGASDYIRKPIDKIELIARTNSHVQIAKHIQTIKEKDFAINKERNDRIEIMAESVHSVFRQMQEMIRFFEIERQDIITVIINLKQSNKTDKDIIETISKKLMNNQKIYRQYVSISEFHNQEDGFIKQLLQKHPDLLPAEAELCLFLKKNLSSKEIASLTFKSPNTIKVARSRLRKKLGLTAKGNLFNYLNSI